MKNTAETTNNLVYKTSKTIGNKIIYVTIRLNDECKNGHEDFSITGDIYEADKPKIDKYHLSGGCIHEEILKHFPEFKIFVNLHLSDFAGTPMYAVENGFYHLKNSSKDSAMNYIRVNKLEFLEISKAEDVQYFTYLLFSLGIIKRWEKEAKQAIALLESLTGNKFKSTATRVHKVVISKKEKELIETRINKGYYTVKEIQKREEEKTHELKKKQIAKIKNDAIKEIRAIEEERDIMLYILNKGISIENVIYYKHSKECVFNWKDYEKKVTQEEFDKLIKNSDLPKNVTFKIE